MTHYIEHQLWMLKDRKLDKYMSKGQSRYYSDMVAFFLDVKDPTDLVALAAREWPNPYQDVIDRTAKFSGVNDRREVNGNDFWVEETTVLGD